MTPAALERPFVSLKNIPLWVGLILRLTLGVVGVAHHWPKAETASVEAP